MGRTNVTSTIFEEPVGSNNDTQDITVTLFVGLKQFCADGRVLPARVANWSWIVNLVRRPSASCRTSYDDLEVLDFRDTVHCGGSD